VNCACNPKLSRPGIAGSFGFLIIGLLVCAPAWSQLVQWRVADGGNGHYYEVVSAPGGVTWGNANLSAGNRGGYLATITSAAENAFIFKLAEQDETVWRSGYGPWLGGIQAQGSSEPAGGWSWVTGEPFTYLNWSPGQPNNNQNEDRIQFGGQANRSSKWNDVGANTTDFTLGYVVEHNQHPDAVKLSIRRKDADHIQLSWHSRPNISYAIQWSEGPSGEWKPLTTIIGNESIVSADDSLAGSIRIYRCVVE
jgi:hypothetical protein